MKMLQSFCFKVICFEDELAYLLPQYHFHLLHVYNLLPLSLNSIPPFRESFPQGTRAGSHRPSGCMWFKSDLQDLCFAVKFQSVSLFRLHRTCWSCKDLERLYQLLAHLGVSQPMRLDSLPDHFSPIHSARFCNV